MSLYPTHNPPSALLLLNVFGYIYNLTALKLSLVFQSTTKVLSLPTADVLLCAQPQI